VELGGPGRAHQLDQPRQRHRHAARLRARRKVLQHLLAHVVEVPGARAPGRLADIITRHALCGADASPYAAGAGAFECLDDMAGRSAWWDGTAR